MTDFLFDFFQSDIVKEHMGAIIGALLLAFLLGAFLTWLYMEKIHMKCVINENADLTQKKELLEKEIEENKECIAQLQTKNKKLLEDKQEFRFYEEMRAAREPDKVDEALESFLK